MQWLTDLIGWPWYTYGFPLVIGVLLFLWLFALLFRVIGRNVPGTKWLLDRRARWPLALTLACIIVLSDVIQIGRTANRLCREQGGLHVFKTVEAEGFEGSTSIEYWSKYGFKYVDGYGKRFTLVYGKKQVTDVPQDDSSRYVWGSKEDHVRVTPWIYRSSSHVVDRRTGEELGTLVWFTVRPGWFERWLLGILPAESNPWICGDRLDPSRPRYNNHYTYSDLVMAVIKPVRKSQGKAK